MANKKAKTKAKTMTKKMAEMGKKYGRNNKEKGELSKKNMAELSKTKKEGRNGKIGNARATLLKHRKNALLKK